MAEKQPESKPKRTPHTLLKPHWHRGLLHPQGAKVELTEAQAGRLRDAQIIQ